jgi:hypothetical protein
MMVTFVPSQTTAFFAILSSENTRNDNLESSFDPEQTRSTMTTGTIHSITDSGKQRTEVVRVKTQRMSQV